MWLGHWVYLLMELSDRLERIPNRRVSVGWLYPIYHNLMMWSSNVQDWGGAGAWQNWGDHNERG